MMRRTAAGIVAALMVLLVVRPSNGLFHLALIDEVMTSYGGDPTAQFIEVNMLGASQNLVANSVFAAFNTSGTYVGDILVVPGNVPNSGNGVRWIVGTTAFQTASGLTPDFLMPSGILPTAGGMVCFGGGGGSLPANPPSWDRNNFTNYIDCVAYGTYAGPPNFLTGTPTMLNGDGHSLQRVSSNFDNATDFACGDPATPQNNLGTAASMPATVPCITPGVCPGAVDIGCAGGFGKGLLLVKEAPAGKEKLIAKLAYGPLLAQTDLGNPLLASGTDYKLCIYNSANALIDELDIARSGDTCGTDPCWKAIGGAPPGGVGYKYKDDALTADGVFKIIYKSGAVGKSKLLVKGRGAPLPNGIAAALQSSPSATVQFRGSDAPVCLSVTLTDIKKNEPTFFKAKN
jgi:hypothetical protein